MDDTFVDGLYYDFDQDNLTAEVIAAPEDGIAYTGAISIPEKVEWFGKTYSVTSIGQSAFAECDITSVSIPRSVNGIKASAFSHSKLNNIDIPDGVESVGESAFGDCKEIVSVYLGKEVSAIGKYAFAGCDKLTQFFISDENTRFSVNDGVLYDYQGKTLIQMPGAKTMAKFPSTLERLGVASMAGNQNITTLSFPESLTYIDDEACMRCAALNEIQLPSKTLSIGNAAFKDCSSVKHIRLGEKLMLIDDDAFSGMDNLAEIYVAAILPPSISASTFSNYNAKLYVPVGRKNSYSSAQYWKKFSDIEESDMAGIETIIIDDSTAFYDVYNSQGILVMRKATADDLRKLPSGIYIIGGKKVFLK